MPWFNLVNGGHFGENDLHPSSVSFSVPFATSIAEATMLASMIYSNYPRVLADTVTPTVKHPNAGKTGGYSPLCESMTDVLNSINATTSEVGLENKVNLSVNMNSSAYSSQIESNGDEEIAFQYDITHFAAPDTVKIFKTSEEQVDEYFEWMTNYPLVSIEDGFEKRDSASLIALKEKIESEVSIHHITSSAHLFDIHLRGIT